MVMHQTMDFNDTIVGLLKNEDESEKTMDRITEKFYISFFQRKLLAEQVHDAIENFDNGGKEANDNK